MSSTPASEHIYQTLQYNRASNKSRPYKSVLASAELSLTIKLTATCQSKQQTTRTASEHQFSLEGVEWTQKMIFTNEYNLFSQAHCKRRPHKKSFYYNIWTWERLEHSQSWRSRNWHNKVPPIPLLKASPIGLLYKLPPHIDRNSRAWGKWTGVLQTSTFSYHHH